MAKSGNQKLKLLYLLKILYERTDEAHCMQAQELIEHLSGYDISAERKSIYDDIECLIQFGYDILYIKSKKNGGYYMGSRRFELPELKLLADAVLASRFITLKKSRDLISKIEKLAGPYEAKQLQRQVFVAGRVKTENESIYYNVDNIHNAIQDNRPVTFIYLEWNIKKQLQPRKEGRLYQVSPWALTWKDEYYYLIAYDGVEEKIKHFRVDKMSRIKEIENEARSGIEAFQEFNIAEYTNKTFGMYGGEPETVTLQLPASMIGIMIDRFGREIDVRERENGLVTVRVKAAVSGQFYGWITGIGERVTILSPENVKNGYVHYINKIIKSYDHSVNFSEEMQ